MLHKLLKKLKNKLLLWWRKLLKMNNHIYYCRIYVRWKTNILLLPLFIDGKDEKTVNKTIARIITAISESDDYIYHKNDTKFNLNEAYLKNEINKDFTSGKKCKMAINVNSESSPITSEFNEIKIFKSKDFILGNKSKEVEIDVILVKPIEENNFTWVFPPLTLTS